MHKKERIFYYDFLRALAISFVIICHMEIFFSGETTLMNTVLCKTLTTIGAIGVPIFFMISGALLLNREYDLKEFLKKRFIRIIYPFIFWIIIILIGVYHFSGSYSYMWNMFFGVHEFTWYIWVLIGIYLFIPIINSFIKEYGLKGVEYFLIIWFFTMLLKTFNLYPLGGGSFDLLYFSGFLGYPILGYYLNNKQFSIDNNKLCALGLILSIISLGVYVYISYIHSSYASQSYQNIFTILMASGLFLFIRYFDKLNSIKDNLIGKTIVSISICSYGMYFAHVMVIKFLSLFNTHSTILLIPLFIAISLMSWLATYVLSKIPYLKKFSGV